MTSNLDRRRFLRNGAIGAGALVGGSALLAACGDDKTTASTGKSGSTDLGTLDFQLSWVKNAEFCGNYIADNKGYYKAAGFSKVNLIAGGPGVSQEQSLAAGKAIVCTSGPDITAPAILKGIPLIAIGALFQKNPFCFVSRAEDPINTPAELKGKKIGVQDVNLPIWQAFLKANGLDIADMNTVPVQFNPEGLVTKEVDAWFSFVTNEPNSLKAQGHDVAVMMFADNGYPLVSQIYVAKTESVKKDRDKLKALLTADIKGWRDSIKDFKLGADLAVSIYGKDQKLDKTSTEQESESQNKLILSDDTKVNGIMTVTDELVSQTLKSLAFGGINITADKLFDFSILKEVYADHPELKKDPTA